MNQILKKFRKTIQLFFKFTHACNAWKPPHNIINTKTTEINGAVPRTSTAFLFPVKYFLISTQKNSIPFAFSLLGRGKDRFYSTSTQEQSFQFEYKKKSTTDLVPSNVKPKKRWHVKLFHGPCYNTSSQNK